MRRRALLAGMGPLLVAGAARAEPSLRDAWLGTWRGSIVFRRSLPLEDVYPPPRTPKAETDDKKPILFEMTLSAKGGQPTVCTRIDGGPMQTMGDGETLIFASLTDGAAALAEGATHGSATSPFLMAASLTARPDAVGTETLYRHADGNFWRRHINLRFVPGKAEVIVWVFDAEGTRARTWRGEAFKTPPP
jgi:hypothetical protein